MANDATTTQLPSPLFALLAALALSACGGDVVVGEPEPTGGSSGKEDDCDVGLIFEQSCGLGSVCHLGEDSAGVNLYPEDLALSFVDVPALKYREGLSCPDPAEPELFINSENLEASLFWTKLKGTQDCGTSMPVGVPLPDDEMACIYSWMEELVAARYSE